MKAAASSAESTPPCTCHRRGREGRTRLRETKVFLGRGVGVLHWGRRPELVGLEAHDDRSMMVRRAEAELQDPLDGPRAAEEEEVASAADIRELIDGQLLLGRRFLAHVAGVAISTA